MTSSARFYNIVLATRLIALAGICMVLGLFALGSARAHAQPVTATEDGQQIVMTNGIVSLTISKKKAEIVSIKYSHSGQETEMGNPGHAMYFDSNVSPKDIPSDQVGKGPRAGYEPLGAYVQIVKLVQSSPDRAEVALSGGPTFWFPFYTEVHYILFPGHSGFYAYVVYKHDSTMPAASLGQCRFVIRGPAGTGLYTNHVVDDKRKGPFPTSPVVRSVMDATFLLQDGTVYTKYNNTAFMADHHFHGMTGHGVGIWVVTPSNEYCNGGPVKQELTVHMDNTLLSMLDGGHFGAGSPDFNQSEPWTKVYGPFMVYLNNGATTDVMYADAKRRSTVEEGKWPYTWLNDPDYPLARGTVRGRITLTNGKSTAGAWAVLADPGGDWPMQSKNYEFWTQVDKEGRFSIDKVRPGTYTLYVYGADQFEQYHQDGVAVTAGKVTDLSALSWEPVTHGRILWEIGKADRSTGEFKDGDDVRHWANYMRYPKDFPDDVTYVIGKSHENADWNFAQWTWYCKKPYWTIQFQMPKAVAGTATLTLGICSANPVHGSQNNLQVRVNGDLIDTVHLSKSGAAGYRSGGEDSLYRVVYVPFDAGLLKAGTNEITLGDQDASPFPPPDVQMQGKVGEVMYDAVRLELAPLVQAH
ncbi:MAG TPA: polysaccharide lyase family protein [Capsulimonadaceae bacterium]|nr:polysaccharide lyase family protein [Capsulimonadaceae bacterium]